MRHLLCIAAAAVGLDPALAAVPGYINYQARLTSASGVPLEGSQTLTFNFYDSQGSVTPLASQTLTANASKGLISVQIPATASLFSAAERWLEVSVGDEALLPRTRLASVPYAHKTAEADHAASADTAATATAATDSTKVLKAGDTMTGTLTLPPDGLVAGTNQLVLSGGKVGIGTTAPATRLHTYGGNADITIEGSGPGIGARLWLKTGASPSAGGDGGGQIWALNGNDSARAGILMNRVNAAAGTNLLGDWPIQFFTAAEDEGASERMRIAANGNVGIRTASPSSKLHIEAGTNQGLQVATDNSAPWAIRVLNRTFSSSFDNGLQIYQKDNGEASFAVNTIQNVLNLNGGNVGIGKASPQRTLDVNGIIHAGPAVTLPDNTPLQITKNGDDSWVAAFDRNNTTGGGGVVIRTGQPSGTSAMLQVEHNHSDVGGPGPTIVGFWVTGSGNVFARGNVGIGTTAPDQKLTVQGNASKSDGGSGWAFYSDERLKDLRGRYTAGLKEVLGLNPIRFRYSKGNPLGLKDSREQVGVRAQEVERLIPEAVSPGRHGYLMMNNDPIFWAMLNAIKEQEARIEALEAELKGRRDGD